MYNNLMIVYRINTLRNYVEKSVERLSMGKAINSAADSPSCILRISRMSSQIRGTHAAQRNIQDAMSLSQIMESSIAQMHDMGLRLKELSILYNNSILTSEEKAIIEKESIELVKEIKTIIDNTMFSGINVFAKDKFIFQTGNSIKDEITIENPLYSKMIIVKPTPSTPTDNKEVISRTYDISMKLPFGQSLTGEIKVNLKDLEKNKHVDFTINTGIGEASKGKLSFIDDNTARFDLHVKSGDIMGHHLNIKLTGTIELNGNSNKTDLSGEGTYTMDREFGGWSGKIGFTLRSQEEIPRTPKPPCEEEKINFKDIDKIPIGTILKGDFVDNNILNTLAGSRAIIGGKQNILEFRLSRQQQTEEIMTNALSKIEDLDMAKEIMLKTKNDLLLHTNLQLLSQNLDDHKNYILQLLG
jgi:flagellin-like hook-associated protein FlgL